MSDINIIYYGHACFCVSYEGHTVIFDPYQDNSVPGLKPLRGLHADAVYCSHSHDDHNASFLIDSKGEDPFPVSFMNVPHDHHSGKKRGTSNITIIQCGKVKLAHMGDIGRLPLEEEYAQLKDTDVLLIPTGGYYTIDACEAKQITERIENPLTILMHYKDGSVGYDVLEDISTIANTFSHLQRIDDSSFHFDENDIPHSVITLKAKQKDFV